MKVRSLKEKNMLSHCCLTGSVPASQSEVFAMAISVLEFQAQEYKIILIFCQINEKFKILFNNSKS